VDEAVIVLCERFLEGIGYEADFLGVEIAVIPVGEARSRCHAVEATYRSPPLRTTAIRQRSKGSS
jgi:hypothetical protein